MKFNFVLSRLALKDLEEIWYYTFEHWSKQQANKYYKDIFEVIHGICKDSLLGKSIDDIKIGHRKINVKSHMIIYKIKQNTIYVDRILHQNMDIDKHINL